jgi:hypothetical protein
MNRSIDVISPLQQLMRIHSGALWVNAEAAPMKAIQTLNHFDDLDSDHTQLLRYDVSLVLPRAGYRVKSELTVFGLPFAAPRHRWQTIHQLESL